ncbi:16S rRNA (cytosine(967)-C(5))-methyltransferase RsmB [Paenibacillus thermotolerans]|uniref:16S rRNA (cytosine(967)-C(5))-methyltransferase RsmB n=1 Tax=Paenibacillus thermotolerans TaxID=3027807 RepID=UPI002368153D|nr:MULTISPECIES: 16S rRNA (cytosine(967)-C(5))-methyltransferase RsmB [unclassified Paenibacillus]
MSRAANRSRPVGARELALQALLSVEAEGAYSNLALNEALQKHRPEPREAALATELVYGTIQRKNTLDTVLNRFINKGVEKLQPWVRSLFRLSAYQLLYLDRVPAHAAVSEAVAIAKRRGHQGISGMVNAVLRNVLRTPDPLQPQPDWTASERIAFVHSHPEWLVKRWIGQFGEETAANIAAANNEPPSVSIRANTLRISRDELLRKLTSAGIDAKPSDVSPSGIVVKGAGNMAHSQWYKDGLCTIQDESSMLVASALAPPPKARVLDCCAAPGGKTTHLAELMGGEGTVVSCDIHPHKRELIESNVKRLELSNVETHTIDATKLAGKFPENSFDAVLLDAPCSGFGVIRRKPDIKWSKRPEDVKEIAGLQHDILTSIHGLLRPGGTLVYSTCTLDAEENERQIERFLSEYPMFELDDSIARYVPQEVAARCAIAPGQLRVLPHYFGSDGFFIARLRKK